MTDKERISELESALQKAQAEAAAMREALEKADCFCNRLINHMCPRCLALATDSGKVILERLEEARRLLEEALLWL